MLPVLLAILVVALMFAWRHRVMTRLKKCSESLSKVGRDFDDCTSSFCLNAHWRV